MAYAKIPKPILLAYFFRVPLGYTVMAHFSKQFEPVTVQQLPVPKASVVTLNAAERQLTASQETGGGLVIKCRTKANVTDQRCSIPANFKIHFPFHHKLHVFTSYYAAELLLARVFFKELMAC